MVLQTRIKGGRIHHVPLHSFVVTCIDDYLEKRLEKNDSLSENDWLFAPLRKTKKTANTPLLPGTLKHVFSQSLKNANINRSDLLRYGPHVMRTTLATVLLNEENAPLDEVQDVLGHSSPTTTTRYIKRKRNLENSTLLKMH